MEADYKVKLDVFEGPLDLLLYLIKQDEIDIYDISLERITSQYLEYLVKRGVSCNVASFIGATTVRVHELGYADRPPNAGELERMKKLAGPGHLQQLAESGGKYLLTNGLPGLPAEGLKPTENKAALW